MDRLAVSISCGNTNHVGRDAWYRFFDNLQDCVSDHVNGLKETYRKSEYNFLIQYKNIHFYMYVYSESKLLKIIRP